MSARIVHVSLLCLLVSGCMAPTDGDSPTTSGTIRLTEIVYRYDVNASIVLNGPIYGFWATSPILNGTFYPQQDRVEQIGPGSCVLLRELVVDDNTTRGWYREDLTCRDGIVRTESPEGVPIGAIMLEDESATGLSETGPLLLAKGVPWSFTTEGHRVVVGETSIDRPQVLPQELAPFTGTVTWLYHGEVAWALASIHGRPETTITHAGPLAPGAESTF